MGRGYPNFQRWMVAGFVTAAAMIVFTPSAKAIPAFARKYNVKCYTCHTFFPRLNKLGYEFKRLGYRMPPDVEEGQPPKLVSSLDATIPWKLTDAAAVYVRTSVSQDKTSSPGTPTTSTSSINLDQVSVLFGGAIPESGFSYFGEFVAYQDGGTSTLERAKFDYTGGTVRNSFFVGLGKSHTVEGYSSSDLYGMTDDDWFLGYGTSSPNGIYVAQSTGLIEGGYTYMSEDYKYVVGLTAKVTNGLDVNGEGIGNGSTYNHKDYNLQADFLFGNNGSVSVNYYNGKKDTVQNQGTPQEFTYVPSYSRWGVFAHYKFFDQLDVLGCYMGGNEDWKGAITGPTTTFSTKAYGGEIDYYIQQNLVAFTRYDVSDYARPEVGLYAMNNRQWIVGMLYSLTKRGNLKLYAQYIDNKGNDLTGVETEDKQGKIGVDFAW